MNEEQVDTNSLLNEDLTSVDTSMPLLQAGLLEDFTIVKQEVRTNEETGRDSLALTLNATKELPDKDGNLLPITFPHYVNVPLTPSPKMSISDVKKAVASWTQAASVKMATQLEGRIVKCKVTIEPAKGQWPEKNRFRPVPPAK